MSREVVTKDQVSTEGDSDCEDPDSPMKYWQDTIKSTAKILEILGSFRFVPYLVQPPECKIDFYELVEEFEICLIKLALSQTAGQQKLAAELLNLKPTTLHEKLKTYGLVKEIRWHKRTSGSNSHQ
jgi:DNA-binding NtrC family response regulator